MFRAAFPQMCSAVSNARKRPVEGEVRGEPRSGNPVDPIKGLGKSRTEEACLSHRFGHAVPFARDPRSHLREHTVGNGGLGGGAGSFLNSTLRVALENPRSP